MLVTKCFIMAIIFLIFAYDYHLNICLHRDITKQVIFIMSYVNMYYISTKQDYKSVNTN